MPSRTPRHRQRGVGLIEILVAVVLLSIGFLGAARMQMQSMRYSQNAYFQSQAYFLAAEMADRMRANLQGVANGDYDGLVTDAAAPDPGCDAKFCDATEIARQDLHDWSARLHSMDEVPGFVPALPGSDSTAARGSVSRLAANLYAVRLQWEERVETDATTDEDAGEGDDDGDADATPALTGDLTITVAIEAI